MSRADAYAVYVEKELVGKRVKSTKVKVSWKLACGPKLNTHEVQLKHSLLSGKREIMLDNKIIFTSKKSQNKAQSFKKSFAIETTTVTVHIEDGNDGFIYDLLVNGMPFHKTKRISVTDLEKLRKQQKSEIGDDPLSTANVKSMGYKDFVQKEVGALDGVETKDKEENLLEDYEPTVSYTSNTIQYNTPAPQFAATASSDPWGNPFETQSYGNPMQQPYEVPAAPVLNDLSSTNGAQRSTNTSTDDSIASQLASLDFNRYPTQPLDTTTTTDSLLSFTKTNGEVQNIGNEFNTNGLQYNTTTNAMNSTAAVNGFNNNQYDAFTSQYNTASTYNTTQPMNTSYNSQVQYNTQYNIPGQNNSHIDFSNTMPSTQGYTSYNTNAPHNPTSTTGYNSAAQYNTNATSYNTTAPYNSSNGGMKDRQQNPFM